MVVEMRVHQKSSSTPPFKKSINIMNLFSLGLDKFTLPLSSENEQYIVYENKIETFVVISSHKNISPKMYTFTNVMYMSTTYMYVYTTVCICMKYSHTCINYIMLANSVELYIPMTSRVARFFLVQQTKKGENVPNDHKIYQTAIYHTKWP
jgi:hypothetical protein